MLKKLIFPLCICVLLTGCQPETAGKREDISKYSTQIFSMDTVMDVTIYGEDDSLLDDAALLVSDLDSSLSTTSPDSEIYQLNHTGSASLSPRTSLLFDRALEFCEKTDGALDLSIYPVVRAWGFTTDTYQIPTRQELDHLLSHVDYRDILFSPEEQTVSLPEGMEVDLGSVAKGFTGDLLLDLFQQNDISSALLNLGGNVQTLGAKPDGTPWRVGIQDPLGNGNLGVLSIVDQAVITSGGYERYFQGEDGTIYWHIIDPETGFPARNGLISATAVGSEGVYCDALSTSLFIMGPEKAIAFWKEQKDFEMILVTEENKVLLTPGLATSFRLTEGSPYQLEVIPDA